MVYGKHKRKTLEKQNKRSLISGRIGLQSCFIIFKLKQKNQMERHGYYPAISFFKMEHSFFRLLMENRSLLIVSVVQWTCSLSDNPVFGQCTSVPMFLHDILANVPVDCKTSVTVLNCFAIPVLLTRQIRFGLTAPDDRGRFFLACAFSVGCNTTLPSFLLPISESVDAC